jgi:ParB-like chromosome segregation protein Spo0J
MEQQQQMDEKFMSDNGWQCVPYASFPVASRAMMMKRDKKNSGSNSGSVKNLAYDYFEDIEDDGDSELVKTIKRLRRNKINCQPDDSLPVKLQAMMIRGPMSMMDATARVATEEAARVAAKEAAQVAHLKKLASTVAREAADNFADKVASQKTRDDQEYFSDLLAGRFQKAPSSPIDIPRKEGGKKRSYKKRTNVKKRSYKKRTNAKKRSYKKRN